MRVSRTRTILGIALALAAATAVGAQGHPGPGPGPGGPPDPVMGPAGHLLHELDLSFDQRRQVRETVRGAMEGELGALARDFGEARHALETLVWDPGATDEAIRSASDVVAGWARALDAARHRFAASVLSVLTEEQREAFREMLAEGPMPPPGPRPPVR